MATTERERDHESNRQPRRKKCEEPWYAVSTTARTVEEHSSSPQTSAAGLECVWCSSTSPMASGPSRAGRRVGERLDEGEREGAARLLRRLAAEYGVADSAERRSAVGDAAAMLGQIAAEEAADLIVVGARARGRLRRGLESQLADQLETETPVPVLIAPPRTPTRRRWSP